MWLKARRDELRLSQDDLAARLQISGLDVSRAAVSHWETGRDKPPIDNRKSLAAIARALEMLPAEVLLLAGESEEQNGVYSDAAKHGALIIDRLPPEAQRAAVDQLRVLERLFAKSGS